MKAKIHVVLTVLTLIGTLLLFAGPVSAKATQVPFTGTWTEAVIADSPARGWFTPGGRWQARGWWLGTTFLTGDDRVDGAWEFLFDNHFDATGTGPWNGTFRGEVDCGGVWEGTFTGTCYGGWGGNGGIGYYRGHGSGCVEGMQIFFELENVVTDGTEDRTLAGYILAPHGE